MTYCHEGRRTRAAKPGGVGRCEEKEEEEGGKVAIPPDFQEGKGEEGIAPAADASQGRQQL